MAVWQWCRLSDLTLDQLYEILRVRQEVFTVEQATPYQDADGKDYCSWHLTAWEDSASKPTALAYLRVVDPGEKYPEPSIGRVLTTDAARGQGLGKELMSRAVSLTREAFPQQGIRISAQEYLKQFYEEFGFSQVSETYDEDGIPHIEMLMSDSQ